MKLQVVFYGGLKQTAGIKTETLDLPGDSLPVRELPGLLGERHPALLPRLGVVAYVVNDEIVGDDYVLRDGDEAGVLPPVSGG
ncbi:MAG TPA: MoaD/ThiS family protein [Aggregatilinea sp.]|jgi:molybdopterin converting factor small subunit|uniref:MoaD/ThiS family protein n=1 Tax=Aggregatilinea sp. TaxID=2806333 RepID=UPI002CA21FBB|nr:MoaD/ThiS family protein [Aggregatilinea sp.]HML24467.1 MoaD/ThiS family protein [Aggregatilinea sp.]